MRVQREAEGKGEKGGLTSLDGNGTEAALLILHLHEHVPLGLPQRLLVLLAEAVVVAEHQLEDVGHQLALVRIVDAVVVFALVRLVRVVHRQPHVPDGGDGTNLALAAVEDGGVVGRDEIEPFLPALGLLAVPVMVAAAAGTLLLLQCVDVGVDGPPELSDNQDYLISGHSSSFFFLPFLPGRGDG